MKEGTDVRSLRKHTCGRGLGMMLSPDVRSDLNVSLAPRAVPGVHLVLTRWLFINKC